MTNSLDLPYGENNPDKNIDDMRIRLGFIPSTDISPAIGLMPNKIIRWPADGSPLVPYEPTEIGFDLVLSEAASGDTVRLPSMQIDLTDSKTLPAGVALIGMNRNSILSFTGAIDDCLILSADSVLRNLKLILDSSGGDAVAVVNEHANGTINQCTIFVSGGSASNIGVRLGDVDDDGGQAFLLYSSVSASGTNAIEVDVTGMAQMLFTQTPRLQVEDGAALQVSHVQRSTTTLIGSGTIETLPGTQSAWDTANYPDLHADDIELEQWIYHKNPAGEAGGLMPNKIILYPGDGSPLTAYDPDETGLLAANVAADDLGTGREVIWLPDVLIEMTQSLALHASLRALNPSSLPVLSFQVDGIAISTNADQNIQNVSIEVVGTGDNVIGIETSTNDLLDGLRLKVSGGAVSNVGVRCLASVAEFENGATRIVNSWIRVDDTEAGAIAVQIGNGTDQDTAVLGNVRITGKLQIEDHARVYTTGAVKWDSLTLNGSGFLEPQRGDRSAWDVENYPDRHAGDIENSNYLYHTLPYKARLSLTDQAAEINDNFLFPSNGGTYFIHYYLVTTSADILAGTLSLSFSWTDDAASQSFTSDFISLNTAGSFISGTLFVELSSITGTILYTTNLAGNFESSIYALYLVVEKKS